MKSVIFLKFSSNNVFMFTRDPIKKSGTYSIIVRDCVLVLVNVNVHTARAPFQFRLRSRNMRKMALSKIESVHTVGTTISVTISMWLVRGSAKHTYINTH